MHGSEPPKQCTALSGPADWRDLLQFCLCLFFSSIIHMHTYIHIQSWTYKKVSLSRRIQNFNTSVDLDIFIHFLNLYTIIYCISITIKKVGFLLFSTKAKTHVTIHWMSRALASNLSWTPLYNQCRGRERSTPRT